MGQGLFEHNIVLKGWKSIAGYLGWSVSTAKRHYKWHGLPVRSFPSGRLFAFKLELDNYFLIYQELLDKERKTEKTDSMEKG